MTCSAICTNFATVNLPGTENPMSRRYLQRLLRWLPTALETFQPWPQRPACGHFFGGVFWYGLETSRPVMALALAASSPEYDATRVGMQAAELRQIARQGLRYLCLTHDTGPPDCIRPHTSWGRPEPAGRKWGERGQGFFAESQCGITLAHVALSAALLNDLIEAEERRMLAVIASDYIARFAGMAPRSGVYDDTQSEENGWTALGLIASLLLLGQHDQTTDVWHQVKRWFFCAATRPQDAQNLAPFADGQRVRDLCGGIYTLLPDGTTENHGFVHPYYLATVLTLSSEAMNLLHLFGQAVPPHGFWQRQATYNLLKQWCDAGGAAHCPQGMDWPYWAYPVYSWLHAAANVYLRDPDAALLERQSLAIVEQTGQTHDGRLLPLEVSRQCHGPQDPARMQESAIDAVAHAYLAHRLLGAGETPSAAADLAARLRGVTVYPHGGFVMHRHARGQTSVSWRNHTMLLPSTRAGIQLIGPQAGTMLGTIAVQGRAPSTQLVDLKIRDAAQQVAGLLIEDLAQASVRRFVFFASLPHGTCLTVERLIALQAITVEHVQQGYVQVINDGYFDTTAARRGRRQIFWEHGTCTCEGYVDTAADDTVIDLQQTRWINIDDQCGLVFRGSGQAQYHNRHTFPVWQAVADELILSLQDRPQVYQAGEEIAALTALWCPEQTHQETAQQALRIHAGPPSVAAVEVDGFLCAGNFSGDAVALTTPLTLPAGHPLPLTRGVTGVPDTALQMAVQLAPGEVVVLALP